MYDFSCTSHEGWTSPLLSLLDKGAIADSKNRRRIHVDEICIYCAWLSGLFHCRGFRVENPLYRFCFRSDVSTVIKNKREDASSL